MARRWVCPACDSGVIAPDKPRKNDVRRFCLDCSKKTGKLVERVCPALTNKRAQAKEKRAAKTARKRDKAKVKATQWPNVLQLHFSRFKKLKCWANDVKHAHLVLRHRPGKSTVRDDEASGYAKPWSGRIVVTAGSDRADAIETLLHELAHVAAGFSAGHGDTFRSILMEAAREVLGQDTVFDKPSSGRCYHLDRVIVKAFERAMEQGSFELGETTAPPKKKRARPQLSKGMVRFNISSLVWTVCSFDEYENFVGLSDEAWSALQNASGNSKYAIVTTTLDIAREIREEIRAHDSEDSAAVWRCVEKIDKAIQEATR
jgi:hypothetical protein